MRMSGLLLRTLRDAPGDAEAASHQLLVRGGYIRRVASGVYTYLPLGLRVIEQLKKVIRQEMDEAGAQEVQLPILTPTELFEITGRLATMDDILFRTEGRGGKFLLGPTHEEVMTVTVAADVESYRDLPRNVYQIATKFRDEARPRFGLVRGREFLMKDAYSFDASEAAMQVTYRAMYEAYLRIFERCGLHATPVEADAGVIGGKVNHEFMVPSTIGEDFFARCTSCNYSANTEVAEVGMRPARPAGGGGEELVVHHTPDRPGIDLVVEFFAERGLTAAGMLKCLALVDDEGRVVVALVPGDREVRVPAGWRPFEDADFDEHAHLLRGYIGPMGLQQNGVRVIADPLVQHGGPWVTGANQADHHVTGATLDRDFTVDEWVPVATVATGDPCPRCDATLELIQAVEAGHCFQNGLKYAVLPGTTYLDADGKEQPYWQGCYGIGISRLMAVVAEEHHDDAGLIWPAEVAPFAVHLLSLGANRNAEVAATADRLHDELAAAGVDVLYDDRDVTPGVKFADADLLGLPTQLIVGAKGLANGIVERKLRATGERDEIALDQVVSSLTA